MQYPKGFADANTDPDAWLTATAVQPTPGTFSSQTRNLFYGPGFQNWNLALFKNFRITEAQNVQFRAEAFNFPNHPNWGGASGGGVESNPRSATFGKITNKGGERNIQLSLRYQF